MDITRNEKRIAAATPGLIFCSGYISVFLIVLSPAILYFVYRKFSLPFAQLIALKIFDLSTSILALAFGLGLLNSALLIVAHDGEFIIPLVSSGLSKYIIAIPLVCYYLVYLVMFTIFSIRGKALVPSLSFGIFEALRGKRVAL